jgi:hypothetical protein
MTYQQVFGRMKRAAVWLVPRTVVEMPVRLRAADCGWIRIEFAAAVAGEFIDVMCCSEAPSRSLLLTGC